MPCGTPTTDPSVTTSLLYNEFIVYNTAQARAGGRTQPLTYLTQPPLTGAAVACRVAWHVAWHVGCGVRRRHARAQVRMRYLLRCKFNYK